MICVTTIVIYDFFLPTFNAHYGLKDTIDIIGDVLFYATFLIQPTQGLMNAIVFTFNSKTTRDRIIAKISKLCCSKRKNQNYQNIGNASATTTMNTVTVNRIPSSYVDFPKLDGDGSSTPYINVQAQYAINMTKDNNSSGIFFGEDKSTSLDVVPLSFKSKGEETTLKQSFL